MQFQDAVAVAGTRRTKCKPLPDAKTLNQLLRYEASSGRLFWRRRSTKWFRDGVFSASHACNKWNTRYAGREAFTAVDTSGYRCGRIFNELFQAHRVIWAMTFGSDPADEVDHRNGQKTDNRLPNLRQADRSDNNCNKAVPVNNVTGFKGVRYLKRAGLFAADIQRHGKRQRLGQFRTAKQAHEAYCAAAIERHGAFARLA